MLISRFLFPGVSGSSERNGGPPCRKVRDRNNVRLATPSQRNRVVSFCDTHRGCGPGACCSAISIPVPWRKTLYLAGPPRLHGRLSKGTDAPVTTVRRTRL